MTTPPPGCGRLLAAASPARTDHLATFGLRPSPTAPHLIAELERAGLTGRGGAGFPVHLKIAAVTRQRERRGTAVVIGNGSEGEPLSAKDVTLLTRAPHLVLDGLMICADALGARPTSS